MGLVNGYGWVNNERVYRFAFTIEPAPAHPNVPPANAATIPLWTAPLVLVAAAIVTLGAVRLRPRNRQVPD